jgi:hypothetical protein
VSRRIKLTHCVLGVCLEIQGKSQSSSGKDSVDGAFCELLIGFLLVVCRLMSA